MLKKIKSSKEKKRTGGSSGQDSSSGSGKSLQSPGGSTPAQLSDIGTSDNAF